MRKDEEGSNPASPLAHTKANTNAQQQAISALTTGAVAQGQATALALQHRHGNRYITKLLAGLRGGGQAGLQREASGAEQPLLRQGASGPAVLTLQQGLVAAGVAPGLDVDGAFGPATAAAVRALQAQHDLTVDGVVGQRTWLALQPAQGETGAPVGAPTGQTKTGVERGAETPDKEARAKYYQSLALYKAGDYQGAIGLCRQVYAMPELRLDIRRDITYFLGSLYQRLGQIDQAVAMYQEYILFPGALQDEALERIRQTRTGEKAGRPDASQITPEQQKAADAKANEHMEAAHQATVAGDPATALDHAWEAYKLAATSAEVHTVATYLVGRSHKELGNFPQALDFLQEALGRPGLDESRRLYALEMIRQVRLGQKTGKGQPAPSMTEDEQHAKYLQAKAAFDAAQYETALTGFKEIYAVPKARPDVRRGIAVLIGVRHHRMQQFDQAISWYQESLLFPNVPATEQASILEKIRQARMGEAGLHLYQLEGKTGTVVGNEQILFAGMVYFDSGKSDVGPLGQQTIRSLVNQLSERHQKDPERAFRIELVGASSRRWQSAKDPEQASQLNLRLATERTASIMAMLQAGLPKEGYEKGVFNLDPNATGDQVGQTFGLDPADNTWTQRNVAITVWSPITK